MKSFLSLALIIFFSWPAMASQALLDCQGPKIKLEAWFMGKAYPEDVYIYEIDPTLGFPSQYSVSKFEWSDSSLKFQLSPTRPDSPTLEFHLRPDSISGGYTGPVYVIKNQRRLIFPHHRCDFR